MTALTIVGGLTIETVEKANAQSEIVSIYSAVKKSSVLAFSTGRIVVLSFEDQRLEISVGGAVYQANDFDQLYFESQTITFSKNGVPNIKSLRVKARDIERRLDLRALFNRTGQNQNS
jgi:hypothetical protein